MRNLEDFCVPNDGEIPVCEINGTTHSMNHEYALNNISILTTCTEKHPKIHITPELLHHAVSDEGRALFIEPTHTSFLKHLSQIYSEKGLAATIRAAAAQNDHVLVSKVAYAIYYSVHRARRLLLPLMRPLKFDNVGDIIGELSQTHNWRNNLVRCMAWHPHASKLAVATRDDSIRVYLGRDDFVPILRSKEQKNITSLAWRPLSLTELAVGHEHGVLIWNIEFNTLVTRPSASHASLLRKVGHEPVLSVVWSPKGDVLVSSAANDTRLLVWDVELNKSSTLIGSREFGNSLLRWSGNNNKLLSLSNGLVFKIWDCQTWVSERWTVLSGRVQSAAWANQGRSLLFATTTETVIYGLMFNSNFTFNRNEVTNTGFSPNNAIPLYDCSRVDLDGVQVGGLIQGLETDPDGNHLAVFFKECSCVLLFNVTFVPTLQLLPSSLVVGLAEEMPSTVSFQQNFAQGSQGGACLSIAWSSGRVQHFPIVYVDLDDSTRPVNNITIID